MADPVISAGINAGGNLIGGGMQAVGEGRANKREASLSAQHAKNLSEFIREAVMPSDYSGLEAQANKLITRGQAGLNATMGAQGLAGSGGFQAAGQELRANVLGNLAESINADQLGRATLGGQLLSNSSFGFFDEETQQATTQGK